MLFAWGPNVSLRSNKINAKAAKLWGSLAKLLPLCNFRDTSYLFQYLFLHTQNVANNLYFLVLQILEKI